MIFGVRVPRPRFGWRPPKTEQWCPECDKPIVVRSSDRTDACLSCGTEWNREVYRAMRELGIDPRKLKP